MQLAQKDFYKGSAKVQIFGDILGGLELTSAQASHRSVLGVSYGSQMVDYMPLEWSPIDLKKFILHQIFAKFLKFLQIFGNPMVNMNRILRFTMQLAQRTFTREVAKYRFLDIF